MTLREALSVTSFPIVAFPRLAERPIFINMGASQLLELLPPEMLTRPVWHISAWEYAVYIELECNISESDEEFLLAHFQKYFATDPDAD